MGQKLRWDRAKPWQPTEMKYEEGRQLSNGVVVTKPLDSLAKRARAAETQWLQQNRMRTLKDSPPGKGRKKQKRVGKTIYKPAEFDDVALTALDQMKEK